MRALPFILDNGILRPLSRIRFLDSGGNAFYEGLQVSARKEFSQGFLMTFAYTYSKAEMTGYGRNEGDGINSNTYQDANNRAAEKSRLGFDATHVVTMSFLYNVPMIKSLSKGVAGAVLAGWQTNGILSFRTGFPFTVSQATSSTPATTLCVRIALRTDHSQIGPSTNGSIPTLFRS